MKVMYGDFTANLTQALVQQAEIALKNKRKVFYLVPSFMSVDLESEILELLTIHSQIDLQVLSFKRFAWYFLKNNALFKTPQLTEVGKAMLFRKVLTELKEEDELVIFKGEVHQIGFLEQLVNFSNEMSESLIKPSDLSGSIKLDELAKIMMRYQESLKGQFREEDIIEVFINQISQGELTLPNQALIILEGFSVLTAKERQLIEILEKKGYEIIFGTFISEKAMNCQTIIGNVYEAPRNFLAKFNIQQDKILVNEDTKIDKELTKLSKYWEEINEWHFQPSLLTLPDNATIEIWKTLNMVEEVKAVAKKIRFLVANGVDYQNIQVLCGNLADYNGIIQPIFDKQEIYYYFDDEVKQVNHLLVEFVESLINLEKYNYRYEDIMRLLRTELLPVNFLESDLLISDEEERFCNRRLIDNFELFLLEKGINSRSALEEKFIFEASSQEEIKKKRVEFEKIQQIFIGKQSPIAQFIDSSSFTKFRDVLEFIQPQFSKVVKLSTSQDEMNQHREAWNTLMSLLQEYHAIYQDDDRYFSEMLVSGLKNAVFRKIPASINLVQIKSYELSRPNTSDYVFAIGLIENNFPKKDIKPTILSEEERIHVNEVSKNGKLLLIKTETTSQAMFTASQVFASARKKLFLSSPRIYLDEAKEPSRFLKRLVEELGIKYTVKEIVQINHIDLDQIGSYYGLLEDLGNLSRELMTIEENDMNQQNLTFWKIMYRILLKKKKEYQELFTSLSEEITPTKISEQVLQILYNKEVNASVSSIENFYNCEYKYFLANSLNLQQIDTMTLDSKIQGNYFHKVFQILLANGFPVVEMFEQKMNEAIQSATIEFQRYFEYNQFNQYLKQQFDKILYSIGEILRQQSKVAIKIEATEFGFGRDNIPGLILELFQNKKLKIRGFIDRIDLINQTIGAVDYKSGKKTFDLSLALDGLQLQLLTYMDYLKSSYTNQTKQLWGAAYLSLLEPVVKLNDLSYFTQEAVLQKQSQQLLYNGIYIEETISSEIKSLYNGTAKNTFTNKEVEKLIENNRELFVNAGNELISGDIKINPAIDSKKVSIGCQYCRFKSICRYEPNIHCGRQIGNQKLND